VARAPSELPLRARARRRACPALCASRVEFEALPSKVADPTLRAVEALGGRVTVGDVAARAGLKLAEAEAALTALAADTGATLKVSASGDLLYVYPPAVRANLAARSWRLRAAPLLTSLARGAALAVRVAFGATLLASLLVVYTAVTLLLSSRSDERDSRRSRPVNLYFGPSLFDFALFDPYAAARRRELRARGQQPEMGFLESVFSFVFGDGDPNSELEERRWAAVGRLVQRCGGVVTAEQLAPLLEPGGPGADESFVLPALVRLEGAPVVTPGGDIIYRFDALAKSARAGDKRRAEVETLSERAWAFSAAPAASLAMTVALGAANALGVVWLGRLLANPAVLSAAAPGLAPALAALLPPLQAYAALFFAIPAGRWALNAARNAGVERRNEARRAAARRLQAPPPQLQRKLRASAEMSRREVFDERAAVFSSSEEATASDDGSAADFDRRLRERELRKKGSDLR